MVSPDSAPDFPICVASSDGPVQPSGLPPRCQQFVQLPHTTSIDHGSYAGHYSPRDGGVSGLPAVARRTSVAVGVQSTHHLMSASPIP